MVDAEIPNSELICRCVRILGLLTGCAEFWPLCDFLFRKAKNNDHKLIFLVLEVEPERIEGRQVIVCF